MKKAQVNVRAGGNADHSRLILSTRPTTNVYLQFFLYKSIFARRLSLPNRFRTQISILLGTPTRNNTGCNAQQTPSTAANALEKPSAATAVVAASLLGFLLRASSLTIIAVVSSCEPPDAKTQPALRAAHKQFRR